MLSISTYYTFTYLLVPMIFGTAANDHLWIPLQCYKINNTISINYSLLCMIEQQQNRRNKYDFVLLVYLLIITI